MEWSEVEVYEWLLKEKEGSISIQKHEGVGMKDPDDIEFELDNGWKVTCWGVCLRDMLPFVKHDAKMMGVEKHEQEGFESNCLWYGFFVRLFHSEEMYRGMKNETPYHFLGKTV